MRTRQRAEKFPRTSLPTPQKEKQKFQHKICFIKFLFFYFISTLHQAFRSQKKAEEAEKGEENFSPSSWRSENTLKSPRHHTAHNNSTPTAQQQPTEESSPLFLLYHQKIIKIEERAGLVRVRRRPRRCC